MLSFEVLIPSVSFPGLRVGIHLKIGNVVMICRLSDLRSSMGKLRALIITDGMKARVLAGLIRLSDL